jgi:uncharacterized Fe-S cluster-containing radical SAM superfamily enzyme
MWFKIFLQKLNINSPKRMYIQSNWDQLKQARWKKIKEVNTPTEVNIPIVATLAWGLIMVGSTTGQL